MSYGPPGCPNPDPYYLSPEEEFRLEESSTTSAQNVEMNEELHYKTLVALAHVREALHQDLVTPEDYQLLCYHCGVEQA